MLKYVCIYTLELPSLACVLKYVCIYTLELPSLACVLKYVCIYTLELPSLACVLKYVCIYTLELPSLACDTVEVCVYGFASLGEGCVCILDVWRSCDRIIMGIPVGERGGAHMQGGSSTCGEGGGAHAGCVLHMWGGGRGTCRVGPQHCSAIGILSFKCTLSHFIGHGSLVTNIAHACACTLVTDIAHGRTCNIIEVENPERD